MKRTKIEIVHEGTTCDPAAIKRAFDWLEVQLASTGVIGCSQAAMATQLGQTSIEFKLTEVKEQPKSEPIEPNNSSVRDGTWPGNY